jgi:sporulation related protein
VSDEGTPPPGEPTPPAGDDGPPAGEETPATPRCEVCGAELEPDQTYCLECGSPTPLAPRIRRGTRRTTAALVGAMVVLGIGAGALAYAVAADDDGTDTTTLPVTVATSTIDTIPLPPVTLPSTGTLPADTSFTAPTSPTSPTGTGGFDTVTGPPPSTPTTPTTPTVSTSTVPPAPTPGGGASDWPRGTSAWTAVLSSVRSESDARAAKARLRAAGEPAGVLDSSDFPDLRPGYWVVFSGRYQDRARAIAQATALRDRFPGAYARRIQG